jgi:hypothetical protein
MNQSQVIDRPLDNLDPDPMERNISLTPDEIRTLWLDGILSDTAYVALALKMDEHRYQRLESFDIESFAVEWQADQEDSNGNPKVKVLKTKAVRAAIDKMNAASLAKVSQQLSLQLNW